VRAGATPCSARLSRTMRMHAQVPYPYITLTPEALHWVHPNATVDQPSIRVALGSFSGFRNTIGRGSRHDATSGCRIVPLVGSS
jgi:hypothetical protein